MISCHVLSTFNLNPLGHDVVSHLLEVCDSRSQSETSEKVQSINRCNSFAFLQMLKNGTCL